MAARPQGLLSMSWQFQGKDWEALRQAIPEAKAQGASRIQLSHDLIMRTESLWDTSNIADGHTRDRSVDVVKLNEMIKLAGEQGLAVDVWTHEISGLDKDTRQNLKGWDDLEKWLTAKYKRVFELLPDADGLVMTFAETGIQIYTDKAEELGEEIAQDTPVERLKHLILIMTKICNDSKKLLILRTFVYEPDESNTMRKAIKLARECLPADHKVVVMSKCVPHDWSPYYPFNPLLGKFKGCEEWVEIDLGQEFTGQSQLPHAEVDYVKAVASHALARGVHHVVARVERYENSALGTLNEVNLYALSCLLKEPGLEGQEIWKRWAEARYGVEAAPHVIAALSRTFEIINLAYYPLEQWVTNHSQLPTVSYALSSVQGRRNDKWLNTFQSARLHAELERPSPSTLEKIDLEKDKAKALLEASIKDLKSAKPYLAPADYKELMSVFKLGRKVLEVFRYHQLAIFGTLYCRQLKESGGDYQEMLEQVDRWLVQLEGLNKHTDLHRHFSSIISHQPSFLPAEIIPARIKDVRSFRP